MVSKCVWLCGLVFLVMGCAGTPEEARPIREEQPAPADVPSPEGTDPEPSPTCNPDGEALPRIMVLASGGVHELPEAEALRTRIEEIFQEQGFETIDGQQLASVKDVDAALSADDPAKLLALVTRYGAEVLIRCAKSGNASTARVLRTDTGQSLASMSEKGMGHEDRLGARLVESVREACHQGEAEAASYQLMVDGVDADLAIELRNALLALPGAESCEQRRMQVGVCELELRYAGGREKLVAELLGLAHPRWEVTGFEAVRIDAKVLR